MSIDKINFDGTEIEIPRKTSQLTNDNNFITLSDIPTASNATLGLIKLATIQEITDGTNETNAITPKQLKNAIEGIGTVFDLKGSVDTLGDLPTENNEIGDVWYVKSESVGYIWLNDGTEDRWEQLGPSINLSNYIQITDIVNNLTTDDIEKPLSAYQGKVLNESISNVRQSIPTKTSQLTNDSGYITGYTETDPTVPEWAKAETKPTYAYSEITEKPTLATVATSGSYNDLTNKPNIPSEVTVDSALSTTSENAVQNKVVTENINGLSTRIGELVTTKANANNVVELTEQTLTKEQQNQVKTNLNIPLTQEGTTVTVGGEAQTNWSADTKVDKTTSKTVGTHTYTANIDMLESGATIRMGVSYDDEESTELEISPTSAKIYDEKHPTGADIATIDDIPTTDDALSTTSENAVQNKVVTTAINTAQNTADRAVPKNDLLNLTYPVGSIYLSVNGTSPASLFGGNWEPLPEGYALWTTLEVGTEGTTISAGLPDIKGEYYGINGSLTTASGVFTGSTKNEGQYGGGATSGEKKVRLKFNASNSNSIYGASTTVQPPAYRVIAWKRVP